MWLWRKFFNIMFTEKYNYKSLSKESVDGTRFYCLPDGSKVASVTTILDKTKSAESKKRLHEWRQKVGEEKAKQITTEAAGRGTRMHKWLETYFKTGNLGQPGSNPYSKQSYDMAQTVIDNAIKNVDQVYGIEASLYYPELYAGTTDCVANWKGNISILDFKQTNKPKKREWIEDYFLQLAAYALAHNKVYDTEINTGVILMCSADQNYQEFVLEGKEFQQYCDKWFDRLEQYYKLINII